MGKRDEFVQKMHSQIDRLNNDLKDLAARADEFEKEMREEYEKQVSNFKSKRQELVRQLDKLEAAGEGAWEDLKSGAELAWESLSESVQSALKRLK